MKKKVGIIQLIDSLSTGGAEVLSVNIANALAERDDFNSHLCTTREEGSLKENIESTVNYIFLDKKNTVDIRAIKALKSYIKNNEISIIHAHSTSIFLAFCVKLISFKLKIVWHDHYGMKLKYRKSSILKIVSFFIDTVISVNKNLQEWSIRKLYCKRVIFMNNFPIFNNNDTKTHLKGKNGKRIVHLAAFRPQKDHQNLINAFELFLKLHTDWTLHLVGSVNDDEYSKNIMNLIKKKKLSSSIFIYDSCLDIEYILKQSSIGVLSSKSEGLPLSLLEYGLASLPVVVTDVGECANVVENKKSGLIIKPEDSTSLSKALINLADDKASRIKYAKAHKKNVNLYHSKKSFLKKLIKIYL